MVIITVIKNDNIDIIIPQGKTTMVEISCQDEVRFHASALEVWSTWKKITEGRQPWKQLFFIDKIVPLSQELLMHSNPLVWIHRIYLPFSRFIL